MSCGQTGLPHRLMRYIAVCGPAGNSESVRQHCSIAVVVAVSETRRAPALDDRVEESFVTDGLEPPFREAGRGRSRQAGLGKLIEPDADGQRHTVTECNGLALAKGGQELQQPRACVGNG